ncbi:uncharacterized protein BP5553_05325 [Venustampulla echinocandica]|uniref:F-box domain-containing protein n=1 Tax=Venustampulla echinocandica TaxID=2656787 RepID=A0A370TQV7_9HELO|nr:uncharacterized protein BP5553_05325 [Venustampulla echinocandica]RDL37892.1 hypothetical protein BP5553_05325 [Venustampulla echinocandica]
MAILGEPKREQGVALTQGRVAAGSTTTSSCKFDSENGSSSSYQDQQFQAGWILLFSSLPTEVHIQLMEHLDPVSQMCLGLTSNYFHRVFHTVYNRGPSLAYNIKRYPFSLRMQASICGAHVLNWIWEDWFLRDNNDILWHRSLGELLFDEKTLWGNLRCCGECRIYKPETGYERFAAEEDFFGVFEKEINALEREDVEWYLGQCRRCRAKMLLTTFGKRKVVFEEVNSWEEKRSLGLRRSEEFQEDSIEEKKYRELSGKTTEQYHAARYDYESWEDVLAGLGL